MGILQARILWVGCHALLQGIFPTQGSNPGRPHCRWILYHLGNQGSTWILKWVACPFSRGSSQPRNRTGVSCFAGRFFTNWALPGMPNKVVVGNKIIFSLVLVNGLMYTDLFFNDFIYLFLAALSLHCCIWAFSSAVSGAYSLVAVCWLLIAVDLHAGFSSCSSWALEHRLSSCGT